MPESYQKVVMHETKGKLPICIFPDMDMHERRRNNLRALLKSTSFAEMQRRSGVPASYLSSSLKQLPDGRHIKNMGEKIARKLEAGLKLSAGWLDQEHGEGRNLLREENSIYSSSQSGNLGVEGAVEVIRLALMNVDGLTRAQAKPIIDALFLDPSNSQSLGKRMAITLGISDQELPKREAA
jgi:hypothetical protein